MRRRTFLLGSLAATIAHSSLAEEPAKDDMPDAMTFGHLRGRFVFEGPWPKPAPVPIVSNADFFKEVKLTDESLLVHPKDKGLANVMIALITPSGEDAPLTVHRSYEESAKAEVELDFHGARISPHVLPIRVTQTLKVVNRDPVAHNCNAQSFRNPAFNVLMLAGGTSEQTFKTAEDVPFPARCNIHPWMQSYIWVRDNPYFAVTGEDGSFEIRNLPLGKWRFKLWHERMGFITRGTVGEREVAWEKGEWEIEVRASVTDLGEIHLAEELVNRR